MHTKLACELLAQLGEVAPQRPDFWTGPFPLPTVLEDFYRDVGPMNISIEGYGNPTFFPSLSNLWEYQAGYRYNSDNGASLQGWDDDWIVVADEGADPYILSRATGAILYAMHGQGVWEPKKYFEDITTMAACLATLGVVVLEAGDSFIDDACDILPIHREKALERLKAITQDEAEAERILTMSGWQ